MITTVRYICDVCHTPYETSAACEICERSHTYVLSYREPLIRPGHKYPSSLFVEMSDHHVLQFDYVKDHGEEPDNV